MLLTPTETALIMSRIEQRTVTVRQVYYLLERYILVGLKIGQSIRITEEEIAQHYDGDTRIRARIGEFADDIGRYRNGTISAFKRVDDIPSDICGAAQSLSCGRQHVEHSQKRPCRILQNKRNAVAQLEFDFAA